MKTECSYCRQHYTLDDRYEGQLLDCPQCGHKFVAAPLEEGSQFIPPEEFTKRPRKKISYGDILVYLPRNIDRMIGSLKKINLSGFLGKANRVITKLSIGATIVYAILFVIYCLKNTMICTTFNNSGAGMYLGIAALALISIAVNSYLIYKTDGIFEKIITASPVKISSLNIFSIMTFICILLAVISFGAGIYFAVTFRVFLIFIAGTAAMLLFIIFALFNAAPEHFAVTEDENASAGEDLIAVITFGYKTFLRLIPIILLLLPIAGGVMCIAEIFTSYVETFGDKAVLDTMEMFTKSSILGLFLTTGFIPLIAYFNYLINYLLLDIVRAILSLPRALNESRK